jgi:hypothetical protein
VIFGGFAVPVAMRMLPDRKDPEQCLVDLSVLALAPKDSGPIPIKRYSLGPDDTFAKAKLTTEAADLGFDQDFVNIPLVQRGMRAKTNKSVMLGGYLESQIRHFHNTLDTYLTGDGPARPQR